jgi:single-stranded-DNA-specific exonuclease
MQKRWHYIEQPDEESIRRFGEELGVGTELAVLLLQRHIDAFDVAKRFFLPALGNLYDPFRMKDMDLAVQRLLKAFAGKEKILIYGDYDVDGTTSVALVFSYLSTKYSLLDYYIPDRYNEGYGVSDQGIQYAHEQGFSLIISLDCGIKAISKVKKAADLGIDFIICDHHRPGEELPPAVAVLDPKRSDCAYPFKELSGCGVGFKLMQALCEHQGWNKEELFNLLDLLAVSIAADIVPVLDENRVMAHFGLIKLNEAPRPGLKALKEVSNIRGPIDIGKIVFTIGPRINAAGRIKHARAAVDLLISEDEGMANELAHEVDKNNDDRRNVDLTITREAIEMIQQDETLSLAKSTVLFKSDWHKGVIGIVASRCIEHFYRPTIILTESNSMATGSARSVPGFDVYNAIEQCSELLEQFGGHRYAAGLTMPVDNVDAFRRKFEEVVRQNISDEMLVPLVTIDLEISLSRVNDRFFRTIKRMAPFGPGNMQPVFSSANIRAQYGSVRVMKEEHLKFVAVEEGTNASITVIGFGMAQYAELIESGMKLKMAYNLGENEFMGQVSVQAYLKDLKFD